MRKRNRGQCDDRSLRDDAVFADHRVVLVENSGFFKNKCEELADYIKNSSGLYKDGLREEEVDKRNRMYKAVKSEGRIVEFAKQDEKTLMRWAAGILDVKDARSPCEIWNCF